MFLCGHVLISIVEVEPELPHTGYDALRVFRGQINQRHRPFEKGVLHKIQKQLGLIQSR